MEMLCRMMKNIAKQKRFIMDVLKRTGGNYGIPNKKAVMRFNS